MGNAGLQLFHAAWNAYSVQRVFADVPDANEASVAAVTAAGLAVQRRFVRMSRGPRVQDRPLEIWACSGPAKG